MLDEKMEIFIDLALHVLPCHVSPSIKKNLFKTCNFVRDHMGGEKLRYIHLARDLRIEEILFIVELTRMHEFARLDLLRGTSLEVRPWRLRSYTLKHSSECGKGLYFFNPPKSNALKIAKFQRIYKVLGKLLSSRLREVWGTRYCLFKAFL